MTALTHAVVVSLSDNPAYEVSKLAWNQAHPLPGNAGEVFFSDGASGITTSSDLTFDTGSKTLHVQLVGGDATNGLTLYADDQVAQTSLVMVDGASSAARSVALKAGSNGFFANTNGTSSIQSAQMGITLGNGTGGVQDGAETSGSIFPDVDNVRDLGGLTADLGEDRRFRTGYFGTSVVVPTILSDALGGSSLNLNADGTAALQGFPGAFSWSISADATSTVLINTDSAQMTLGGSTGTFPGAIQWFSQATNPAFLPGSDNTHDLGGLTAGWGSDLRYRTGYFGTSVLVDPSGTGLVDAALYSVGGTPGADGTVSGADLAAQSLSFVKGIYVGLV